MKSFNEYFSLDDYRKIYGQEIKDMSLDEVYKALDLFLTENKILKPFTNHKTHRTNFGYSFDNYLNNNYKEYEKKRVLEGIIDKTICSLTFSKKTLEESYNSLIEKVNSGNFSPFELVGELYDFESGERFNFSMKNWEPTLVIYIPGENWTDRGRFEVAQEEVIEKVLEKQIEFKTGNLIVADWFKFKEFNDLVDQNNKFDINSEKGRIEQAEFYLNNFNFIHSTAWNSSEVYQDGDTFLFIQSNDELNLPSSYKNKGYVHKELRAISIIEKEQLIDLIGDEQIVNKYLESSKNEYVKLKVKPGTYTFTLSSGPEFIKESFPNLESSQNDENKEKITQLMKDENFKPTLILQALSLKPTKKNKMR